MGFQLTTIATNDKNMKTKIESFKSILPGIADEDTSFDKENLVSYGK